MTVDGSHNNIVRRALVVVGGLGTVTVVAVLLGATTPAVGGTAASTAPPDSVTQVPSSVPPEGVDVNTQVILMPPAALDGKAMTSDEAIKLAEQDADTGIAPVTLFAQVTVPGTLPPPGSDIPWRTIEDRQAWVVTFTSQAPVEMDVGPPGYTQTLTVSHYSVALDAATGEFLIGFYTK